MHDQADRLRQLVLQDWVRVVFPLTTAAVRGDQAEDDGHEEGQDRRLAASGLCPAENVTRLLPTPPFPVPSNDPNVGRDPDPQSLADRQTSSQ